MLPHDIVPMMEMYGRGEFDPRGTGVGVDVDITRKGMVDPALYPIAQADPDAFVTALAAAVLPVGGWAVYGASRLIRSLLGSEYSTPAADMIFEAGLQWLRDNRVTNWSLSAYEWRFWQDHRGKTEPWIPTRPDYHPHEAPITELAIGEMRRVAQFWPKADSNVLYIRRNDEHSYVGVMDRRFSDEDPRRSQDEWKQAETLRSLYTEIGAGMQMFPYWCDSELEAFIPYSRPRIPVW